MALIGNPGGCRLVSGRGRAGLCRRGAWKIVIPVFAARHMKGWHLKVPDDYREALSDLLQARFISRRACSLG